MLTIDYEHEVVGAQHAAPSSEPFVTFVVKTSFLSTLRLHSMPQTTHLTPLRHSRANGNPDLPGSSRKERGFSNPRNEIRGQECPRSSNETGNPNAPYSYSSLLTFIKAATVPDSERQPHLRTPRVPQAAQRFGRSDSSLEPSLR